MQTKQKGKKQDGLEDGRELNNCKTAYVHKM